VKKKGLAENCGHQEQQSCWFWILSRRKGGGAAVIKEGKGEKTTRIEKRSNAGIRVTYRGEDEEKKLRRERHNMKTSKLEKKS